MMLDDNKAPGMDRITADHLKNAGHTGFVLHVVLPESITAVLLVPVIKDKALN